LGIQEKPDEDTMKGIEEFICQLYQPKTAINTVEELRWSLFKKRQAESDKLPLTKAALHQAILRAHYQLMVWNNDCVANPVLPSPRGYGWTMEDDEWIQVMTTLLPALEAIIQLVKCKCAKQTLLNKRVISKKKKFQPRFHVDFKTSYFEPPSTLVLASYRVATKTFHTY